MKYAFIALVVIYLISYGCSPDKSEKTTDSHEQTTQTTVVPHENSGNDAIPVTEHEPAATSEQQAEAVVVETEQAQPVVEEPQVAAVEEQPVTESEQVVMPCGRVMARGEIPENAPCLTMQPQITEDVAENGQDLAIAMQKMVETTNNMVLATRQLIIATQEVLNASKIQPVKQSDEGQEPPAAQQE
jgi:hypothetical protein